MGFQVVMKHNYSDDDVLFDGYEYGGEVFEDFDTAYYKALLHFKVLVDAEDGGQIPYFTETFGVYDTEKKEIYFPHKYEFELALD